ncbi:DUF2742 domain-containing protein [Mycobacterium attenuatum]|uniref:DUF2742 domain-containing protein n=1 Tax=Mycobacterium attenuatum TaxID=2341086 RepID=UPI001FCE3466|nr:DUF2742 domain-containing protein [Mycobacterium attenuatum]
MTETKEGAGPQRAGAPPSQQRAWWPVHEFMEAVVAQANYGPIPAAGTPSWCALSDGDPRKLLAVAIDGEHQVLRIETAQEQLAGVSKAIAAAEDWPQIARDIRRRSGVRIPREVA